MTKRKTDGEHIADRAFGLSVQDQEAKWLAAEIDQLLRKRMSEAWEEGWFDRDCQEADWNENPYREEKEMSGTIEAIRKRHAATILRADGSHAAFHAHYDRGTLLAEVDRLRTGLHRISLASQHSMSSRGECGRIARETLEGKP